MRRILGIVLALVLIGAIAVSNAEIKGNTTKAISSQSGSLNESQYLRLSNSVLNAYSEDGIYSSYILTNIVKKNITRKDAMTSTMAVYSLLSAAKENLSQVVPPKKYDQYQQDTIHMLEYTLNYLWDMGKFYETNRTAYLRQARANFNSSTIYHDKLVEFSMLKK